MIMQKKFIMAVILISLSAVSYSMDNFFNNSQKKNIDPVTRGLLYTQHKKNKELKNEDEVAINSNDNFCTVGKKGCITIVRPVKKEQMIQIKKEQMIQRPKL